MCDLEGFVAWDGNRYSLPAENVTELLPVRIMQTEIFVYGQDLKLVAQHELRPRGAGELVIAPGAATPDRRFAIIEPPRAWLAIESST